MHVKKIIIQKRILLLTILSVALATFLIFTFAQNLFFELSLYVETFMTKHQVLGPAVFVLFAAASVLLGPVTTIPLVPAALLIWSPESTIAYLLIGWLTGNTGAYAIGYHLGRPIVTKFVAEKKLVKWEQVLDHAATIPLMILFRIAMPSETGYIFGIMRYKFTKYFLVTFVAELPFALLAVYASNALIDSVWFSFVGFLIIWALIIIAAGFFLNMKVKKKMNKNDPAAN